MVKFSSYQDYTHQLLRILAALHHFNFVSLESFGIYFDKNQNDLKKKKLNLKLIAEKYYT